MKEKGTKSIWGIGIVLLTIILLLCSACLFACGKNENPSETPSENTPPEKITVTDLTVWLNGATVNLASGLEFEVGNAVTAGELVATSATYSVQTLKWAIKKGEITTELTTDYTFTEAGEYTLTGTIVSETLMGEISVKITVKAIETVNVIVENGTFTASKPDKNGKYEKGVTIIATAGAPTSGYKFSGWYDYEDNLVSNEIVYTTTLADDLYLNAKYVVEQYKVTVMGGEITYKTVTDVEADVDYLSKYSLSAEEIKGNTIFVGWMQDGEIVATESTREFTMDTVGNKAYVAKYVAFTYNGTANKYADNLIIARDEQNVYIKFSDSTDTCDYSHSSNRFMILFDTRVDGIDVSQKVVPGTTSTFAVLSMNGQFNYSVGVNEHGNAEGATLVEDNDKGTVIMDEDKCGAMIIVPYSTMTELSRMLNPLNPAVTAETELRMDVAVLGFFNNGQWAGLNWQIDENTYIERNNVAAFPILSENSLKCTVKVGNGESANVTFNSDVVLSASVPMGETFIYWTKNGGYLSDQPQITVKATCSAAYDSYSEVTQYSGYGAYDADKLQLWRDENNFYVRFRSTTATNLTNFKSNRYYVLIDLRTSLIPGSNTKPTNESYVCFGFNSSTQLGYAIGLNNQNATNTTLTQSDEYFDVTFDPDMYGGLFVIPYSSILTLLDFDQTLDENTAISICTTVMGNLKKPDASTGWIGYDWDYNNSGTAMNRAYVDTWATWSADSVTLKTMPTYAVSVEASTNGNVILSAEEVIHGESVTLTIEPTTGYKLKLLTVNTADVTSSVVGNTYTVENVTSEVSVSAVFEKITYPVTVAPLEFGEVVPSIESVEYGENITLTVTPDEGYLLKTLLVNTVDVTSAVESDTYTITNVTAEVSVSAVFEKITYTVTITSSEFGEITPSVSHVPHGENLILTIFPRSGYQLATLTVNGQDVTLSVMGNTYTITNVTVTVSVSATFVVIPPDTFNIVIGTVTGGSVTPSKSVVNDGESVTLIVSADSGYRLKSLTVNTVDVTADVQDNEYVIEEVTETINVSAEFEQIFTVSVTGGTGAGVYVVNAEAIIAASTAPEGKTFLYWAKNGKWFTNEASFTETVIADATYTACFADLTPAIYQYDGYGMEVVQNFKMWRDESNFYVQMRSKSNFDVTANRAYVALDMRTALTRGTATKWTDATYMCFGFNNSSQVGYATGANASNGMNTSLGNYGTEYRVIFDADKYGCTFIIPYASVTELIKGDYIVGADTAVSVNVFAYKNSPWTGYFWEYGNSLALEKENVNTWATWSAGEIVLKDGTTIITENANSTGKFCNLNGTFTATAKGASGETFLYWEKDGKWFANTSEITITADSDATYKAHFENLATVTYQYDGYGAYDADELQMWRDESNFYVRFRSTEATHLTSFKSNRYYVLFDMRTELTSGSKTTVLDTTYMCFGFNNSSETGYATGLKEDGSINTTLTKSDKYFRVIFDDDYYGGLFVIPYSSITELIEGEYTVTEDTSVSVCTTVMGTLTKPDGSTGWIGYDWDYNGLGTAMTRSYVDTWATWSASGIELKSTEE